MLLACYKHASEGFRCGPSLLLLLHWCGPSLLLLLHSFGNQGALFCRNSFGGYQERNKTTTYLRIYMLYLQVYQNHSRRKQVQSRLALRLDHLSQGARPLATRAAFQVWKAINNNKLLGALGLTTRSKDAIRGSWPYY